jgi:hypothetical protein
MRSGPTASPRRGRLLAGCLLRSALSMAALIALYYTAPLERGLGVSLVVVLIGGLILFGCLTAWQISAIAYAAHPRMRAVEALATAVPLFLVIFSAVYFVLSREQPASFSEPLSRTDALYFTVTVFATVGFGDITPSITSSRALTTVQMIADLIVVGLVAKLLFGAVRFGLRRGRQTQTARPPVDEPQ